MKEALLAAEPRPANGSSTEKKNYAERLSRNVAILIANSLRPTFGDVTPTEDGQRQEVRARTSKGFKKLDVGYSTPELGLALGVSIKTLNFRDGKSGRFTKNYSRVDNELRAEASDYHVRQPYAVLAGVLFLPIESCKDADPRRTGGISSFGAAVQYFRDRAGREKPDDEPQLFEKFYVALYEHEGEDAGNVLFFDVMNPPPKARQPKLEESLAFELFIADIVRTYDQRNNRPFTWAGD